MLAQLDVNREAYKIPYAIVISCNLYGPHDRFDAEKGHVVPSLVRKFFEAKRDGKKVSVWGNGSARRDFMYVEDVARALELIMQKAEGAINLGSHDVHSIREVVDSLAAHTGMKDKIEWDAGKPNGQEYRAYDLAKLDALGFRTSTTLEQGLKKTYDWYAENHSVARK
jgi:GDP-L-fucose synthase